MITPSPLRETYGYHITVGKNAFYLDGRGKQKVYVIPSQDLVIVRVGESPQNWDDSLFTQVKLPTL
jgi:CubicO group peptidase (beta-lactamase class C family)